MNPVTSCKNRQGNPLLVAQLDEPGPLVGRVGIDDTTDLQLPIAGLDAGLARHDGALIGEDAHRPALDPGRATNESLAIGGLVLVEIAAVDQAGDELMGIIRSRVIVGNDPVQVLGRVQRFALFASREGRQGRLGELGELGPDLLQTTRIIGMTMIHDSRDIALHHGATELFLTDLLTNGGFDQMRPGQENGTHAFDDVGLIAHDRQIGPSGDAGTHDRGHLKDPGRRQPRVVEERPSKVLFVWEDLILQRQEDSGRVHQVDNGQRFSRAISCARSTFLQVIGNQAPAFTVASLDTTTTSRP